MSIGPVPVGTAGKRALRDQMRRVLGGMDLQQRTAGSAAIRAELERTMAKAMVLGSFWPVGTEPDIGPWLRDLGHRGVSLAFPRVDGVKLSFFFVQDPDRDLRPGFRGIPEPGPTRVPCPGAAMEAVIVPGVAFSPGGGRLGHGGGHYDRWLRSGRPPRVVGVAFALQVVANLPQDPWDERMDLVVTESGVTGSLAGER